MDTGSLEHRLERTYRVRRHLLSRGSHPHHKNNFRHYWLMVKTQMNMGTIITVGGAIIAAVISGWFSGGNNVAMAETNIAVIEERENNHYGQVQKQLEDINTKLDKITDKLNVKK